MGAVRVERPLQTISTLSNMTSNGSVKAVQKQAVTKPPKARIADEPVSGLPQAEMTQKHGKENGNHVEQADSMKVTGTVEGGWEEAKAPVAAPDGKVSHEEPAPSQHSGNQATNATKGADKGSEVANTEAEDASAAVKAVRTFYLVKVPRPDNTSGVAAVKRAELKLKEKREKQEYLNAALRLKQLSRNEANDTLKQAWEKLKACNEAFKQKLTQMRPLREAHNRLQDMGKEVRGRGRSVTYSSEAELDQRINELEFQRQHETLTLQEEKKILREIRQLENMREEVRTTAEQMQRLQSEFAGSKDEREAVSSQLKPLQEELDALRKQQEAAKQVVETCSEEAKKLNKAVEDLFGERAAAQQEHQAAYEELKKLRQAAAAKDQEFYENRRDVQKFRQLAVLKDIKALEEFSLQQVDRLLAKFCEDTNFRAAYLKSNEWSTIRRFGCSDGRQLGPDEDPIDISRELKAAGPSKLAEPAPVKAATKEKPGPKEHAPEPEEKESTANNSKTQKKPVSVPASSDAKPTVKAEPVAPAPEVVAKTESVDLQAKKRQEAEEKERRRQEEVHKAKEAEERKRKQAERNAAKAAARAKKEEEEAAKRKEREKEKKLRKRASASDAQQDGASAPAEAATADVSEPMEETPAPLVEVPAVKARKQAAPKKGKLAKLVKPKKSSFLGMDNSKTMLVVVTAVLALVLIVGYLAAVTDWNPASFPDGE